MDTIEDAGALRDCYPEPKSRALRKVVRRLDAHCARFIEFSPFCVLATASPEAQPDLSPRGGAPGFVRVLDDHTLMLPDRPGNNRLDTLSKLAANPELALLFFVPGVDETLRVYGRAAILAAGSFDDEATGLPSPSALRIDVERAFFHCGKAPLRARLWRDEARVDRSILPSLGEILKDQIGDAGTPETQDEMLRRYAEEL
jgi:uncharacterized protein